MGGKAWFSNGDSRSRGVAVLCKKNFPFISKDVIRDTEGRYILVRGEIEQEKWILGSVYGPNKFDASFYSNFFERLDSTGVDRKIVAGDFNIILDASRDRTSGEIHKNEPAAAIVRQAIDDLDLVDVWRIMKPDTPGYTWRRRKPYVLAERLDLILITESMLQFVDLVVVNPGFRTDHSEVRVELKYKMNRRGPGYWKLNASLLQNPDYLEKINNLLDIEMDQKHLYKSRKEHWEIIKLTVRGTSLQFAARKKKAIKNKLEVLERKLKYWSNQDPSIIFDNTEQHIIRLKKEIEEIYAHRAQGAALCCRTKWHDLAEKPNKYFLNLEKNNFNKKTIHRLKIENRLMDDIEKVGKELTAYYKRLYSVSKGREEHNIMSMYLSSETYPKISEELSQLQKLR